MRKKTFIFITFFNLFLIFCAYFLLFNYQLGSKYLPVEAWIDDVYDIKDKKAKSIDGKKIIIISGSNSLFGINSEKISEITKLPVLNLAVHASLDIDFLYYKIKKYIGENDIVIMPLEYGLYNRKGYSEWFLNNIIVWGNSYYHSLNIIDKIKFISNVNPDGMLLGVKAKLDGNLYNSNEDVYNKLTELINKEGVKWRGYNANSCNLDGDINVDEHNTVKKFGSYIGNNITLSNHFLSTYTKIKNLVKSHNGKLFLTHPVTFKNKDYDLTNENHKNRIDNFRGILKNNYNIDIQCNPMLFHLDKKYAFNTTYHPNRYGALIRSENLANCINGLLNNKSVSISDENATMQVASLEMKYSSRVKKPPIPNFQKRFSDLTKIKNALQAFYKDNKAYPKSKGYDGIYTNYGDSKVNWIDGLVPKYLPSLPIDPRKTTDGSKQYLYKSDGKNFKLISHSPEDCNDVKKNNQNLIDPIRNCWAYGFWTDGAKNW